MGKPCSICGFVDPIPTKCRHCGKSLCDVHRLPENHECNVPILWKEAGHKVKMDMRVGRSFRMREI